MTASSIGIRRTRTAISAVPGRAEVAAAEADRLRLCHWPQVVLHQAAEEIPMAEGSGPGTGSRAAGLPGQLME